MYAQMIKTGSHAVAEKYPKKEEKISRASLKDAGPAKNAEITPIHAK